MKPHFSWRCSYMGSVWYTVTDETGTYEAHIRLSPPSAYELSIANGPDVRRDMLSDIGLLIRGIEPLPTETIAAFNEWRAAKHAADLAFIDSNPQRYGILPADDDLRNPPMRARAARYIMGEGWQPIEAGAELESAV